MCIGKVIFLNGYGNVLVMQLIKIFPFFSTKIVDKLVDLARSIFENELSN